MSKYSKLYYGDKEYHEIPPFRFPIFKDLVAGEAEGIEDMARKQASNTYALIRIARQVSAKKGCSIKEALDLLGSADVEDDSIYEFADELASIQAESTNVAEQKIDMVTLFMRYRGEYREGKQWKLTDDWVKDDTREMPNKILDSVFEFIGWEKNGWPEPGESEEDSGN